MCPIIFRQQQSRFLDASELSLQVHTEEEVQKVLPIATKHQVPVTFRAAGTSLSGQALTDSVLLKLSHTGRNFRNFEIHVSSLSPCHPMCKILSDLAQQVLCCLGFSVLLESTVLVRQCQSPLTMPLRLLAPCTRWDGDSPDAFLCSQGDGSSITVEPGLIGGEINALLARHKAKGGHEIQYKIGPDPSSIDSCMIGGMVANNSSGMCCGVSQNVRPLSLCSSQASRVPLAGLDASVVRRLHDGSLLSAT